MACSAVCNGHCYVDSCNSYKAPRPSWDYSSVRPFPNSMGDTIHNENIETLAASINDERKRRNNEVSNNFPFDSIVGSDESTTGTLIYATNSSQEMMIDIKTAINQIVSGFVRYNIYDGYTIRYSHIREARIKIDQLRAQCLCNSDCGGHLVCVCHTDCYCHY